MYPHKQPESQRDTGRLLLPLYQHKNLHPRVPVERGERLSRTVQDVLEAGYDGIFIAIDEISGLRYPYILDPSDAGRKVARPYRPYSIK